jgi:hypothetical protein
MPCEVFGIPCHQQEGCSGQEGRIKFLEVLIDPILASHVWYFHTAWCVGRGSRERAPNEVLNSWRQSQSVYQVDALSCLDVSRFDVAMLFDVLPVIGDAEHCVGSLDNLRTRLRQKDQPALAIAKKIFSYLNSSLQRGGIIKVRIHHFRTLRLQSLRLSAFYTARYSSDFPLVVFQKLGGNSAT